MLRLTPDISPSDGIKILREARGYYITNTARDLSQSDFKGRILTHTDLAVAEERDATGYFSLETTGGSSVHVDLIRKQINPFERLRLLRARMPKTMFQTLCRGVNLFGYRPYPENVVRLTVQSFAKYVEVWRVYDFLNHVPNMVPVFEEVRRAGKYLEPSICFSTGPEHTDDYYVKKAGEIIAVTGPEIILAIKNQSGIGTPTRIYSLVASLRERYPDLVIHYHGHNTDGNEIARIMAAVKAGAKIIDASDHALTGFFGPAPALSVILALAEEGHDAIGINTDAIIAANNKLKRVRPVYAPFESQVKGFDSTVHIHKLPGGAMGSSFEQAVEGGFLDRMPEILLKELPRVHDELGNFCSTTPGSQILWTTAVSHTLTGVRYQNPTEDLKRLLLERYGPFPFRRPSDEIYREVLGANWQTIIQQECGPEECPVTNIESERQKLEKAIGRKPDDGELALYLQYPRDATNFFKFEEEFGKSYVLPPEVWFRHGGFKTGEKIIFEDYKGKHHEIVVGSSSATEGGGLLTYLNIDHHPQSFAFKSDDVPPLVSTSGGKYAGKKELTQEEMSALAQMGEICAPLGGSVLAVKVRAGDHVSKGDVILTIEAMKMQNSIISPITGIVKEVAVKPSQAISHGDLLVKIRILDLSKISF